MPWFKVQEAAVRPKSPNSISSALSAITHVATAPSGVPQLITHKGDQPPTSRGKIALSLSWEAVKTALVLIKESSDAFPPLKSAVGGLVALIDMIESTSSNKKDLEILYQKIKDLTSIINENSPDPTFPWVRRGLFDFNEKLNEILEKINEKSNHGLPQRFTEVNKDKADILLFARDISDLVTRLQLQLQLSTNRAILSTSRDIKGLLSNESLKKLRESGLAQYDASSNESPVPRRGCTAKTRQGILDDLMKWAKNPDSPRMYWMNGMMGTGKTTIAYSFCEQLEEKGLLGASFFCSRYHPFCHDIQHIIPTIARGLARSCVQYAATLIKVLDGDFKLRSFRTHLKQLISEPLQSIESMTDTLIIVIDALDECNNREEDIKEFLRLICDCFHTSRKTIPLKIFLTSRPDEAIHYTIAPLPPSLPSKWSIFHIHGIEKSLVQEDIRLYVIDELDKIAIRESEYGRPPGPGWPPSTEVNVIVDNADRLYIYAATVIRYVGHSGDPCTRLSEFVTNSPVREGISQGSGLTTELIDGLYTTILEQALEELSEGERDLVRMVLKLIVCAQTPLTLAGIADLLETSTRRVRIALRSLHSVISSPTDDNGAATTFHASFPDFLFDHCRSHSIIHIPFRQSHEDVAGLCLHLIHNSFSKDNIRWSDRWQSVDDIPEEKIESWFSGALGYACKFWASHVDISDGIEKFSTELDLFLTCHVLRWFEALGLLRRLDIGVEALRRMKECTNPSLSFKFDDAYKFLRDVFDIINIWPCEVYHSGLIWAPKQTFIRKTYDKRQLSRIVYGQREGWGACEQTIRGHSGEVTSVAISPDSCHIVSGSADDTVRIWNFSTGEEERVLRGHSATVNSIAISLDNRHIVSGSNDWTVRIWNLSTGEEEHLLRGHSLPVTSVTVSPDNHVVSGSIDETVRIWDLLAEKEERILHLNEPVRSIAVSPDNYHIVSGSYNTIQMWNFLKGEQEHICQFHSFFVGSVKVAITPDSRYVMSGYDDGVQTWDLLTGEEEPVFPHSEPVKSITVSPDNHHVVSGSSHNNTIQIWSLSTGKCVRILQGHSDKVTSVAVSRDNRRIISGSYDRTIRIWSSSIDEEESVFPYANVKSRAVTISPDNRLVVIGSEDNTVRIQNLSSGEVERVFRGHDGIVTSVAVSRDSRHIVSGSLDNTVRIWNLSTGDEEHILLGHDHWVNSVAISSDMRHVVSGSDDRTIRIWNFLKGEEEHVFHTHSEVNSVTISPDGRHVVFAYDRTVRIWNFLTGEEEVLKGHSGSVCSIAVSSDNGHVISGSVHDKTIRIWMIGKKESRSTPPLVISFAVSPGSCLVLVGSEQDETNPIESIFLSSMLTSVALMAWGDNITSIPIFQRLLSGESLPLGNFLQAIGGSGVTPSPITLAPDYSSIFLSNGEKCVAIPAALRDISCAAFSSSTVWLSHESGRVTILNID